MPENKAVSRSLDQIEREIEETRARMGHTADVLREKVSPAHLRDQTWGRVRSRVRSRGNNLVSGVTGTLRRKPVLYGILGSVLVWWLFTGRSGRHSRQ